MSFDSAHINKVGQTIWALVFVAEKVKYSSSHYGERPITMKHSQSRAPLAMPVKL